MHVLIGNSSVECSHSNWIALDVLECKINSFSTHYSKLSVLEQEMIKGNYRCLNPPCLNRDQYIKQSISSSGVLGMGLISIHTQNGETCFDPPPYKTSHLWLSTYTLYIYIIAIYNKYSFVWYGIHGDLLLENVYFYKLKSWIVFISRLRIHIYVCTDGIEIWYYTNSLQYCPAGILV